MDREKRRDGGSLIGLGERVAEAAWKVKCRFEEQSLTRIEFYEVLGCPEVGLFVPIL